MSDTTSASGAPSASGTASASGATSTGDTNPADRVADLVTRVRSKNAGPFQLTIDLFCPDAAACDMLVARLPTARVARAFRVREQDVRRFEIPSLDVLKFSLPRPVDQGATGDRDMHGAQWSVLVAALPLED